MSANIFYYFAYASNLLRQRLQVAGCTTMKLDRVAKIDNYRLAFGYKSDKWAGAVATVEPFPGEVVWGAVWTIDMSELSILDTQEGVGYGVYERIELTAIDSSNQTLKCLSYKLLKVDPSDYKPSVHYLDVIIRGAVRCGLPKDYIEHLKRIGHNGFSQKLAIMDQINELEAKA